MIVQPVLNPLLIALLCAPVAALAIWALVRASTTVSSSPADPRALAGYRALWAMRLVLVLACFAMLLRPGIPGGTTQTLTTDTDIVLVIDTTASIVAEDWGDGEVRLDGIRADIEAIVEEYPGARFALITADAAAELRMPLTTDTTALLGSLDVLRPEVTYQSRGSSIGIAAPLLAETLASAAASSPDRTRMVFYFGDGEQTVATPPESYSSSATYTDSGAVFGYGTADGGPMRTTTGGLTENNANYIQYQGSDALSMIDETNLAAIADQLGVEYQHRTADTAPLLPEAPAVRTDYADAGEVGDVTALYWIAALVILLILGVELTRATMLIARLRRLRDPQSPHRVSAHARRSTPAVVERQTQRHDETSAPGPTEGETS